MTQKLPAISEEYAARLKAPIAFITLLCALTGFIAFCLHLGLREHFELAVDLAPIIKISAFSTAAILIFFTLPERTQNQLLLRPYLITLLPIGVWIVPLLFWPVGELVIWPFGVLAIIGISRLLAHHRFTSGQWAVLLILASLYALHFLLWANTFQAGYFPIGSTTTEIKTFYPPSMVGEIAYNGSLYKDHYYHAAITNMLQAYGKASTGLDGLVTFPYHFGSHLWFAALGHTMQTHALTTLALTQLLLIFPAMSWVFLMATLTMRETPPRNIALHSVCTLAMLSIFSMAYPDALSSYTSITASPALLLFLAALPLLKVLAPALLNPKINPLPAFAILGMLAIPMSLCKAHAGIAYAAIGGYLFARRYISHYVLLLIGAPVGMVFLVTLYNTLFATPLETFPIYHKDTIIFLLSNFPVWMPGIIYFWLMHSLRNSSLEIKIYQEIALISTAISIIPPAYPGGANMLWFSLPMFWVMIVLICTQYDRAKIFASSGFSAWIDSQKRAMTSKTKYSNSQVAAFIVFLCAIYNVSTHFETMTRNGRDISEQITAYRQARPTLLETAIAQASEAAKSAPSLAVFIPASNTDFWKFGIRYSNRAFYFPAIAAIPLLQGTPPKDDDICAPDCGLMGYGYDYYPPDATTTAHYTRETLCARARQKQFDHVLVLDSATHAAQNILLDCRVFSQR